MVTHTVSWVSMKHHSDYNAYYMGAQRLLHSTKQREQLPLGVPSTVGGCVVTNRQRWHQQQAKS